MFFHRYRTPYSNHVRLYRIPLKQIQLRTGPRGGKRSLTYFRRVYLEDILKRIFKKVRIDPTDAKSEVFYQHYYLLRNDISLASANEAKSYRHPLDHRLGIASNVPDGYLKYPDRYIVLNLEHVVLAIMKFLSTIQTEDALDKFLLSLNTHARPFDWVLYQYANILFDSVSAYNDIEGATPISAVRKGQSTTPIDGSAAHNCEDETPIDVSAAPNCEDETPIDGSAARNCEDGTPIDTVRKALGTIPMWVWDVCKGEPVFFRVRKKIISRLSKFKDALDDISHQLVDKFYCGKGFSSDTCFDSNQFIRDDNSYLPISIDVLAPDISVCVREGGSGPMSLRSPSQTGSRRLEGSNLTDEFIHNPKKHPVVIPIWTDSFGDAARKRLALLKGFNLNDDLKSHAVKAKVGSPEFNNDYDNDSSLCDMSSDDIELTESSMESSKRVRNTATVTPATSLTIRRKATPLDRSGGRPAMVTVSGNSTAGNITALQSRRDTTDDDITRLTSTYPFSSTKNDGASNQIFGKRIDTSSVHQYDGDEQRRLFLVNERKVELSAKDIDAVDMAMTDKIVPAFDESNVMTPEWLQTLNPGICVNGDVSAKIKCIVIFVFS